MCNDTGGINGKKIKLFQYDYGYRIPEAMTTYKRFRDFDKVRGRPGLGHRRYGSPLTDRDQGQDALCLGVLFRPLDRSQEDALQSIFLPPIIPPTPGPP